MTVKTTPRLFKMKVLGRTLEHLGVQMYKRRDVAIAELVANCWDAGAKNVWIELPKPESYSQQQSTITIKDDGCGMNENQMQDEYLVVGRNRRLGDEAKPQAVSKPKAKPSKKKPVEEPRPVMGRKGIGKLASFGLARQMKVLTWQKKASVEITLKIDALRISDKEAKDVEIPGALSAVPGSEPLPSGTLIKLNDLKHSTPIEVDKLKESLARRFSRRVRGRMKIFINGELLGNPNLQLDFQYPTANNPEDSVTETLEDGAQVKYRYAFSGPTIKSPELRGFTIYVHGKTAQAPPFYFRVEGTASGQHATKYLTGEIEADFLDDGTDNDSDLIATDRQEIDWEDEKTARLLQWGDKLTRQLFRDWTDRNGTKIEGWMLSDPELSERINKLEPQTQKQIRDSCDNLVQLKLKNPVPKNWQVH